LILLQDSDVARGFFISPQPSANADLGVL